MQTPLTFPCTRSAEVLSDRRRHPQRRSPVAPCRRKARLVSLWSPELPCLHGAARRRSPGRMTLPSPMGVTKARSRTNSSTAQEAENMRRRWGTSRFSRRHPDRTRRVRTRRATQQPTCTRRSTKSGAPATPRRRHGVGDQAAGALADAPRSTAARARAACGGPADAPAGAAGRLRPRTRRSRTSPPSKRRRRRKRRMSTPRACSSSSLPTPSAFRPGFPAFAPASASSASWGPLPQGSC
mmetsp:Transcript_26071/g.69287  ORF Transcript_26071/g.69287 Transcript_26071/m.69287 type:complete len:240 (+) Transcript_26071:74-793(+)